MPRPRPPVKGLAAALVLAATMACPAQVKIVDPAAPAPAATPAQVQPAPAPAMSKDAETMAQIRKDLAEDKPSKALALADAWISQYERKYTRVDPSPWFGALVLDALSEFLFSWWFPGKYESHLLENADVDITHVHEFVDPSAYLPEALYLRGNAKLAMGDEYDALFDYEKVITNFPQSEQFVPCLERELQVARLYLAGRDKPSNIFGLRLDSGKPLAEELILRVCERLPGSRLAERSLLDLADYYARSRNLEMAAETYDVFLRLYPKSDQRALAMQRRVYANIARFKGPGYDTATLKDAMVQIDEFQQEFPAEAQRTGVSDALQARVDESAAAGLLKNAEWYRGRGDTISARLMLTRLIKRHPRTGPAQRALAIIQEIDAQAGRAPAEAPK